MELLQTEPVRSEVDLRAAKRQFSVAGFACVAFLAGAVAVQLVALLLIQRYAPALMEQRWINWALAFGPNYLVGAPLALLVFRLAKKTPLPDRRLSPRDFLRILSVSFLAMYAGNFIGTQLLTLASDVLGVRPVNPAQSFLIEGNSVWKVLIVAVIGPLIEEWIFRKQFIDRIQVYGGALAVLVSAFSFALFHGNLSQFFYAFPIGLVLAYAYLRTGRIRYSAGIHMLLNLCGGVIAPAMLTGLDLESMLSNLGSLDPAALGSLPLGRLALLGAYGYAVLGLAATGAVVLIRNRKRITFDPAPLALPREQRAKVALLNPGMLLLMLACGAMIATTLWGL